MLVIINKIFHPRNPFYYVSREIEHLYCGVSIKGEYHSHYGQSAKIEKPEKHLLLT